MALTKILLIEGDPVLRDLIRLAFERASLANQGLYQINVTADVAEAGWFLQNDHPQLLLIDNFLPQADGLELLRLWRQEGRLEDVSVIVISTFGYREIVQQARRLGVCDFLVKPLDPDVLVQRVSAALKFSDDINWGLSDNPSEP
jgi:DNA-binding response OmpR family regulator